MVFCGHTNIPSLLIAASQTSFKHSVQFVWNKTNFPLKSRSETQTNHKNILLFAQEKSHLKVKVIPGKYSNLQSVIGHNRMSLQSRDPNRRVLNICEKPWTLLFRLLYPRVQAEIQIVELYCGTAPTTRAAAFLGKFIF